MVTKETKIKDIFQLLEMNSIKDSLKLEFGFEDVDLEELTLLDLEKRTNVWNSQSMAEGFNSLLSHLNEHQTFHQIYDEDEIINDSSKSKVSLLSFEIDKNKPYIIILAGGGYQEVASMVEALPLAKYMNEKGYNAFVLTYRVKENARFDNPIADIAKAVEFIEQNLNNQKEYMLCGFSAGAHAVSSFGIADLGYGKYNTTKPRLIILSYGVISMHDNAHIRSRGFFLQEYQNDEAMQKKYSAQLNVTAEYPHTFIWYCDKDKAVSPLNSINMYNALKEHNVICQLESYDSDKHGLGLATDTVAEYWIDKALVMFEQNKN